MPRKIVNENESCNQKRLAHASWISDLQRHVLFALSDWPGPIVGRKWPVPGSRLEMAVLAGSKDALMYRLFYTGVGILVHTTNVLFPANSRFDDWGYDELLPATPGPFRHNILFQTGTEISIVFRVFGFDIRKPTSCELR